MPTLPPWRDDIYFPFLEFGLALRLDLANRTQRKWGVPILGLTFKKMTSSFPSPLEIRHIMKDDWMTTHSTERAKDRSVHVSKKWKWSCSVVSDSVRSHGLQPTRLLRPWTFQARVLEWGATAFSECLNNYDQSHICQYYRGGDQQNPIQGP